MPSRRTDKLVPLEGYAGWVCCLFACFLFYLYFFLIFLVLFIFLDTKEMSKKACDDWVERITHSCLNGWNCALPSPHSYVEVLIPRTSECDFIWVLQMSLVKMRSYRNRVGPNPVWQGECPWPQRQTAKGGWQTARNWERGRNRFTLKVFKQSRSYWHRDLVCTSSLRTLKSIKFYCLNHPVY